MNKLSKIFLIIIILMLIIIVSLVTYILKNFTRTLDDAKFGYENSVILDAAGIEITTDDAGFYTVTDTIRNNILKSDFKVEIHEDGTYTVIEK